MPSRSGSLSFHPELFRGKDDPRHLTTGTRTSHTSASVYALIRGVGGSRLGKEGENAKEKRSRRAGSLREKPSFLERDYKGEQREGGLRSAGEGQLRRE